MSIPPQQPPVNRPTYSRTLSALRKSELVQLSVKFKLPTDGNVVFLRNRLRVYMNYHRDVLMNNPRYRALFPRARDPNIPIRRSELPPQTRQTRSSPALSYDRSPSPALSYDSWHGIEDNQVPIPLVQPHQPSPQPLHPLPHHQEPFLYHHPPPSPSSSESSADSLPPAPNLVGGCKFILLFTLFLSSLCGTMQSPLFPFFLEHYEVPVSSPWDTMKFLLPILLGTL